MIDPTGDKIVVKRTTLNKLYRKIDGLREALDRANARISNLRDAVTDITEWRREISPRLEWFPAHAHVREEEI